MRRRHAALLALGALVFLAGCSGTSGGLDPGVAHVESGPGETYFITFSVTNDVSEPFHDVIVYGYTLEGERVCTASFGTVQEGSATAETTCSRFPSLLVPEAAEMNESDFAEWNRWGPLEHKVDLYRGYESGHHQFRELTVRRGDAYGNEVGMALPPDERILSAAKCKQWTGDGDFSAIGDRPWLEEERRPPETTTTYGVRVENGTTRGFDRNDTYPVDGLTPAMAGALREVRTTNQSDAYRDLNETEYRRAIASLSNQSIGPNESVADAVAQVDGSVRRLDQSGVECWADPPVYEGWNGTIVTVHVEEDGQFWSITLLDRTRYAGPALADAARGNP